MGGLGSGRYDYAATPAVEECRHLNVDQLTEVVASTGETTTLWWGARSNPEASMTVDIGSPEEGEYAPWIRLRYTVTDCRTGERRDHAHRIDLEYTDCNFGGVRPWFQCPGSGDGDLCGRRVGKLYCPPMADRYLCRHCHDLGYTSSRTSGDELKQAELRYRRAYAKLDEEGRQPHPNSAHAPSVPDRPVGMHRKTYEELVTDLEQTRLEWEDESLNWLQQTSRDLRQRSQ